MWAFLSFGAFAFWGFPILSKDAIFISSRFSLTTSDPHGTLNLVLGLIGIHFAVGSDQVDIIVIQCMGFRFLLKSIEFVSYNYRTFVANISIVKWGSVITFNFDCFFLISADTQTYLCCDDSVWYSFKRRVCLKVHSAFLSLLVYGYIN